MVIHGRVFGNIRLFLTLIFTLLTATSAMAYNISGTVINSSGKPGRIFITAFPSSGGDQGPGVSIESAGAFTITGVPSGTYTLQAFVATQGTNIRHANDPAGSAQVNVNSTNVTGQTIILNNPSPVAPAAPQVIVYRSNGGNFVMWNGETDNSTGSELPIADKYRISWSSTNGGATIGSKDVASGDNDFFAHVGGLANYWYKVEALVGAASAASSWTPVTTTSGVTVTGTVNLTGISATGPLLVALVNESGDIPVFCTTFVSSPSGSQSYTVNNVPPGTYQVYGLLDMNNNGTLDYGDIQQTNADQAAPSITVASSNKVAPTVTLSAGNARAIVTTNHGMVQSGYSWLNLDLGLEGMQKQPVNVTVSGPGISATTIGLSRWNEFNWWFSPSGSVNVGDTYAFTTYYSDGTFETLNASITAIIDSYPTPVSPVGLVPYSTNATPTFAWTAPAAPPATYTYQVWLSGPGGQFWSPSSDTPISSGTTSVVYNYDNTASQSLLVDGTTYYWTISVVDSNGNSGGYQTQFTPTSQPAISAFYPASSNVGGTVTIRGINFDPVAANNSVTFGGNVSVTASSVSPDGTTLTAVVPNAGNGNLTVTISSKSPATSSQPFYIGNTVSFTGKVLNSGNLPVAGATIEMEHYPLEKTTSAADGTFTLSGLPGNSTPFRLIIAKDGYLPVYTDMLYTFTANIDYSNTPYYLYTGSELGLGSGKSAVLARVLNSQDYSGVSGVTATASSSFHPQSPYMVEYLNSTTFTGSATDESGIFRVRNIDANDYVTLTATRSGWFFTTPSFLVPGGAVVELGIIGSPPPSPAISTVSPSKAKAGTQVTISGNNFGATPTDNVVKFNGVTAGIISVTASSQILVTVPQGATTGRVTVTTVGGTATSAENFTLQNTLSVNVAGTGSGTVNSITEGLAFVCSSGTCSSDFDSSSSLVLAATPGNGSLFTGWSGACAGTGNCSVTLGTDKSATATFDIVPNVQMGTVYFGSISDAYVAAVTGATIKAKAMAFTALDLNRDIAVTLSGGYDPSLNSVTGYTTIGGLTVWLGSVTLSNVAVQ